MSAPQATAVCQNGAQRAQLPRPAAGASRAGSCVAASALRAQAGAPARLAHPARLAPAAGLGARQQGVPLPAPRRALRAPSATQRRAGAMTLLGSANADLAAYVAAGPIAPVLALSETSVSATLPTWQRLGDRLAKQMGMDAAVLTPAQRARIYHYYLPTYLWVLRKLETHRAAHAGPGAPPALVVGISAPQGCGKTTLVGQLTALLNAEGHASASVSIDDFYVRGAEQDSIAAAAPDNDLLRFRGNAGTHDLALASGTLDTLRNLTATGATAAVPLYDKSLRGGRGDRAPESAWPVVSGPLQVVCLEGWCLGFRPLASDAAAAAVHPGLGAVNAALRTYEAAMESRVDAWVVVRVAEPNWVFEWRLQAEVEMRKSGKPGLSDAQVADFVSRFMPAYKAYLPSFYKEGPTGRANAPRLALDIDATRMLIGAQ